MVGRETAGSIVWIGVTLGVEAGGVEESAGVPDAVPGVGGVGIVGSDGGDPGVGGVPADPWLDSRRCDSACERAAGDASDCPNATVEGDRGTPGRPDLLSPTEGDVEAPGTTGERAAKAAPSGDGPQTTMNCFGLSACFAGDRPGLGPALRAERTDCGPTDAERADRTDPDRTLPGGREADRRDPLRDRDDARDAAGSSDRISRSCRTTTLKGGRFSGSRRRTAWSMRPASARAARAGQAADASRLARTESTARLL